MMKKNLFSLIFCLSLTQMTLGQSVLKKERYFFNSFQLGTSLTYIWERNSFTSDDYFSESTWNVNFASRLSKRFWMGVQAAPIFSSMRIGTTTTKQVNYFAGVFTQVDLLNEKGLRFYLETSLNRSNYCTCGDLSPKTTEGLHTWGLGGGLELTLNPKTQKNLKLELAFYNYIILNDIKFKYNYTQYIIGLNYAFGKV